MRAAKALLKFLAMTALSILALALALSALVLVRPDVLLNDRSLAKAIAYVNRHGIALIQAQGLHLEARSQSLLLKSITLSWDSMTYRDREGSTELRFGPSRVSLSGGLVSFKPKITELGPAEIRSLSAELRPSAQGQEAPRKTKKANASVDLEIPAFLQGARIHPISIPAIQARLFSGQNEVRVGGALALRSEGEAIRMASDLDAQLLSGKRPNWLLTARLQGGGTAKGARLSLDASAREARRAGKRLAGQIAIQAPTPLKLVPLEARVRLDAYDWVAHLSHLAIRDCNLRLDRRESRIDCPVEIGLPLPPPEFRDLHLPTRSSVRLRAELQHSAFPPSTSSHVQGNASIEIAPLVSPFVHGSGGVKLAASGVPSEFPRNFKLDADLGLHVSIPSFQTWVRRLRKTAWAIPAPLHVLDGTVELALSGRADLSQGTFPLRLTTRLASAHQRLNLDGQGQMQVAGLTAGRVSPRADFKLTLSDVDLELPRMELTAPPQFVPDHRIVRARARPSSPVARPGQEAGSEPKEPSPKASPTKKEPNFAYSVRILTPPSRPIRILSNLAKAPVPVSLDLAMSERSPLGGAVHVGETPLELFRRSARVDHFDLTLADPARESKLDARIDVPYADYTVSILLLSTLGDPRVQFMSDPPLPEDQVLATLLFGQPMDQLDADQAQSVGNTRAALADRALNLTSMYLLASTPIQSVGYDPGSQTFTAKVRIAEGTSLNVGAAPEGVQQIGLRKRLGPHWTVTTDLSTPTRGETTSISTLLEWAIRY